MKSLYGDREHAYDLLIMSINVSISLYRSNRSKVYEVGEHAYDIYSYRKHEHELIQK